MLFTLRLGHVKLKAVAELGEYTVSTSEARQVNSRNHRHLYKRNDFFCVFAQREESFYHEGFELVEKLAALTSQYVYVFLR